MSSLGWKWRRLRAMSAQEIVVRVVRAVRERVSPLPKEPPNATWERYYAQHAPAPTLQRIAETLAPRPQVVSALVEAKPLPDNIDEAGVVWAFRA